MTDIYIEISKLTDKFRQMCYGLTNDENKINEAVQELMLYFLQMNQDTLRNIWEKDGKKGVLKYGAVALRRALRSPRSNFYYKYEKYYTHIYSNNFICSTTDDELNTFSSDSNYQNVYNIPQEEADNSSLEKLEKIDLALDQMHFYDRELFKLYYYEGNTLDSLAEKTRISRNSLFTTIDKVRNILKKKLNENV